MLGASAATARLFAQRWPVCSSRALSLRVQAMATQSAGKSRVVRVAHILVKADQALVLEDAEKQLAAGSRTWEDLCVSVSACSSKSRGGELGWLRPGTFFPDFEKAAFALEIGPGKFGRASTPRGLHLIKVLEERFEAPVQQMTVQELQEVLSNPALYEDVQFIDVREEWEFGTAKLPHFKLFPLSTYDAWGPSLAQTLDPSKETLVLCHHGVRSMQMANMLVSQYGFLDVKNITGGIDAFSQGVDSSVPLY